MSGRTRRRRAGDSLLGISIRLSIILLAVIFVGGVLPLPLLIYTDLPVDLLIYWWLGGLISAPTVALVSVRRYFKRASRMTGNTRDEWMAVVNVFVAVFAVVGVLLTLSTFGEQPVTRSQCISPPSANVSSPNCQVIETVSLPNRGPFAYFGTFGIWIVFLGLVGVFFVALFSIVLYASYGLGDRTGK